MKPRRKGKAKAAPAATPPQGPLLFLGVIHNGDGEDLKLVYPDNIDQDDLGLRMIYALGYIAERFNTATPMPPNPKTADIPMFEALNRVRELSTQMAEAVATARREMDAQVAREDAGEAGPPAPRADA